jgi:Rhodanese-like domain
MPSFSLTEFCFVLDDEDTWTLNALLTTSSSYRRCSKRRTLDQSAQATSRLQIEGTTICSRSVRGFGCGSGMASVAELSLRYSDCPKSRPKLPQEFRTRIGETSSRIELECFPMEIKMDSTISTKDLKSKLDKNQGITLVETLAPERYREAHIPGALNIPPERIKELAPQLLPKKDAEIITYCTNTH